MSMLNYNQKMDVIFKNSDILTARHYGPINGLGSTSEPKTAKDVERVERLKSLRTYDEVRQTNSRTPYKEFINQFNF